ncbi:MAG: NUDIX hydrolase [Actinobacteria bacterium]|nr:MAG: NUDIX hydrolase [Actinomycetota bacterium]
MAHFERTKRTVLHEWVLWKLVQSRFRSPVGEEFVRTYVESPGATGIVPVRLNPDGKYEVVMVRQYRPALDAYSLEIPAGMRDVAGEDALSTALRELQEETGFTSTDVRSLGQILQAPGITNAAVQLFLAVGLSEVPLSRHGPEEDDMSVEIFLLDDAVRMIETGEIDNAMAVVGILRADRILKQ